MGRRRYKIFYELFPLCVIILEKDRHSGRQCLERWEGKAMKRCGIVIVCLWEGLMGLATPFYAGAVFMLLTGNGKGYGYDLRGETDISVCLGIVGVFLWGLAVIPLVIWLIRELRKLDKKWSRLPFFFFGGLCLIGIFLLGWDHFLALYGIGS